MKKLILGILVIGVLFSKTAWSNITISPFFIQFDADSKQRADLVRITNSSSKTKTYRIKMVNYRQLEDGKYQEITEPLAGNPFAAPYIGFSPRETTLEPRQSQTIRLQRKPMAAAKDGEYVSHLMVQEMPGSQSKEEVISSNGITIDIRALYGVTIPVIIDKGNLTNHGAITNIKVVKNTSQPYAEVMVKRSGTQSFWGTLVIKEGKEEIGRINNFKIFLSTPQRLVKVPLSKIPSPKDRVILMDGRTDDVISSQEI